MGDDQTARLALARNLSARLHQLADLGLDELRVIDAFVTRLEHGLIEHGRLDLSKSRDWQREYDEELVDAAVYRSCKRVSDRDRQIAAIEAGLGEIVTAAIQHAPHCHATIPTEDRPDDGCICGAWRSHSAEPPTVGRTRAINFGEQTGLLVNDEGDR